MTNNRIYSFAWCGAAELLERRDELDEALLWYEIAAPRGRSARSSAQTDGKRRTDPGLGPR
jgi:hypothetical protein